jgi:uncharacterized membrane protein YeaQ/YmgE (transglycosylase-associated protein family)
LVTTMSFSGRLMRQILFVVTFCCSCAVYARGRSAPLLLYLSVRKKEETLTFVSWLVLGLAAGFIGSRLVDRKEGGIPPDILLGVIGGMAGGWLFYTFGPAGVNGLNLASLFAAVIGSLTVLLAYYAFRRW